MAAPGGDGRFPPAGTLGTLGGSVRVAVSRATAAPAPAPGLVGIPEPDGSRVPANTASTGGPAAPAASGAPAGPDELSGIPAEAYYQVGGDGAARSQAALLLCRDARVENERPAGK